MFGEAVALLNTSNNKYTVYIIYPDSGLKVIKNVTYKHILATQQISKLRK
jgi:hypothetical protein